MTESRPGAGWTDRIWRAPPAASSTRAALWGLATLAVLAAADSLLNADVAIVGVFMAAPFVTAFSGFRRATAAVALAALAAALLSGLWNHNAGSEEYWTKAGLVAAGGVLACFAAAATREGRIAFRRLEILDEIAALTARDSDGDSTLGFVTSVLVPELGEICTIDVIDGGGEVSRVAVRAGGPDATRIEQTLLSGAPAVPADWIGARSDDPPAPRVFEDLAPASAEALGIGSAIMVPLFARGRCTGAVTLSRTNDSRGYSPATVRFTGMLADRIAVALDSTGLFSDLRQAEERMTIAMAVLEEAVVIHDRDGEPVFANAATATMFDLADTEDLEVLSLPRLRDSFDLFDEDGRRFDPRDFTAARLLRGESSEAQTLRAVSKRDGWELWARARSGVVPDADGRPLFVVTALDDVTELKRAELAQALLARLGELLESSLDYSRTVERLSELVVPALADWCSVFATSDDEIIDGLAVFHRDPAKVGLAKRLLAEYPLRVSDCTGPARALRSGRTIVLDSVTPFLSRIARDADHLASLEQLELGAVMALPMRSAGRLVGALVLGNETGRRPFDPQDRELAERVAGRAAAALDNARLATERTEIAETLQMGLLPAPLPDIPGWSVAALYRPAGNQNQVGGDFYDVFSIEGGWMIVVGDVTGRGAQAASVTGQARHTMRAVAQLTGDPLATLSTLNQTLLARRKPALCSIAAIALETGSRTARIAVAGHPPPLLAGAAGVREAGGTGPVLGAFGDAGWELSSVDVAPGDQIVVFTDGVTEAEGSAGRFGEERLRARLRGAAEPGSTVAEVDEALEAFCGGELGDDAALLAISPVLEGAEWTAMNENGSNGSTER